MKVLIHNKTQFGYHTDTYMYCRYLPDNWNVTYVCLDQGYPRIESPVQVEFACSPRQNKFKRFISIALKTIRLGRNVDAVFVVYHPGVSLLKWFLPANTILDIRSRSVSRRQWSRKLSDFLLRLETRVYARVTVVSPELGTSLNLGSYEVLPLGADIPAQVLPIRRAKDSAQLRMIYVGTLEGRDLPLLIRGLALARMKLGTRVTLTLDFAGTGPASDIRDLEDAIRKYKLEDAVILHGDVRGAAKSQLLRAGDLGIVHVPTDGRYDGQPATKLFEYWALGLPVLASAYDVNQRLVIPRTGLLYEDREESFAAVIEQAFVTWNDFSAQAIYQAVLPYSWRDIVTNRLTQLLAPPGMSR